MKAELRAYISVTIAYWAFMLTDGALRMLVLLHFHHLGFSALSLAYLFLVYELMGIVANILSGWAGARFGIRPLIVAGLIIQIVSLIILALLNPAWSMFLSVFYVMVVQGASGIAKDLTKTGSKSAIKNLVVDEGRLFSWVALLTGSKNAIKGLGFFLGAALLVLVEFKMALGALVIFLVCVLVAFLTFARSPLGGKADVGVKIGDVFSTSKSVNRLAVARLFLFAARDTWFVVAVPVFLYSALTQVSGIGSAKAFFWVGGYLAVWIMGYGFVQTLTPSRLSSVKGAPEKAGSAARQWSRYLATLMIILCGSMLAMIHFGYRQNDATLYVLMLGLILFGVVFAVNSSLHSYLIISLSGQKRTTMDVGFYYSANAAGRLLGTLLSGLTYQLGGIVLCLFISSALAFISHRVIARMI